MSEPSPTGQVSDECPVLVERRGHVMVITINRPGARNAVNEAVCLGVGDALEEADHDDGREHFPACDGGSQKVGATRDQEDEEARKEVGRPQA